MGLTKKEKQAITKEYSTPYQAITQKTKSTLLNESTRLTEYHRKSASSVASRSEKSWSMVMGRRSSSSQRKNGPQTVETAGLYR
jgi:hypothetical protein